MSKKINKEKTKEGKTRYGEFISSFFTWIPLDKQKENAKKLENLGKKEKDRK